MASQASGGKGDSTDDCSRLGERELYRHRSWTMDTGHGTLDTRHRHYTLLVTRH